MADLNKVMIIGNLGGDPEIKYTQNGSAVATFRVAANRNYKTPVGDWQQETEWFSVIAWNQLAERVTQSLQRGSRVYIEGRLHTRSWDAPDGSKRFKTEVVAMTVLPQDRRQPAGGQEFGGGGGYGGGQYGGQPGGGGGNMDADITDPDDLPFD